MKAHHEVVIRGALDGWNSCAESYAAAQRFGGTTECSIDARRNFSGDELLDDGSEGIADDPIARARGMNVVEEAENARAVCWAGRKGIGVQQVVAPTLRQVAALFLLGTKAGVIEVPVGLVGREKTGQEFSDTFGILPHDALQARYGCCVRSFGIDSAELVNVGLVGDVLVQRAVGLLLTEQELQKNIAYKPNIDKLSGVDTKTADA